MEPSIDITDFTVGAHVLVQVDGMPDRVGVLTEVRPNAPFPGVVTLVDGTVQRALPQELSTIPASRSIEDIERWLAE